MDQDATEGWREIRFLLASAEQRSQPDVSVPGLAVQTEAPVNLTHVLTDAGGDETGHSVLLSWTYPVPSDLQYGWITLVYELQYRRVTEPDNWKVPEPHEFYF